MRAESLANPRGIHYLVSRTKLGFSMYFYVRLHAGKERKFLALLKGDAPLSLHDFGDVLESGMGDAPSEASVARMRQEFGFTTPPEALH